MSALRAAVIRKTALKQARFHRPAERPGILSILILFILNSINCKIITKLEKKH